jgi:microfibrillar-associated protein 1
MSGAAAGRSAGAEGDKGRIEATKVKRYRPGQVPEWMKTEHEDADTIPLALKPTEQKQPEVDDHGAPRRTGIAAPVIVKKTDDPRLARLAATGPVDRTAALRERHRYLEKEEEEEEVRKIAAAPQIVRRRERPPSSSDEEKDEIEETDTKPNILRHVEMEDGDAEVEEDAIAARRAALKARLLEDERAAGKLENGEEDKKKEEESSEYETDSEEDDSDDETNHFNGHRPLAKPVFVPRTNRETLEERRALEKEAEEEAERQRVRLEQRKLETKELLAARLAEEEAQEAAAAAGPKGAEDILTDDEAVDQTEEYQLWKNREMHRIGRDKSEREREVRDADEKERWKALSEEERIAYLQAHPKNISDGEQGNGGEMSDKNKKKYGFLQKYYHRGAFFQTEATWKHDESAPLAGIATERDFSAPTGEDVFKKESLPEVMQVKNFGRRGRSKWTHLAAEDTTDLNAMPWAQNPAVRKKAEARMAGTEQVFTKPKNTKT